MGESPFFHAGEDLVELRLAHEESVVLRPDLPLLVREIDVDAVCRGDDLEGSPFLWAQHAGKERCRGLAVAGPDDGVLNSTLMARSPSPFHDWHKAAEDHALAVERHRI